MAKFAPQRTEIEVPGKRHRNFAAEFLDWKVFNCKECLRSLGDGAASVLRLAVKVLPAI